MCRVKANIGMAELMRDIHRQVLPVSVRAQMALASIWFATYMLDMAMASSLLAKLWLMRWSETRTLRCFSAAAQIRAMAATAWSG